jgi:hypothetical protein
MSSWTVRICRWLQAGLGTAVFALICYRAATRAIWIDEAFTYNLFVALPLLEAFSLYDANNHLLFTLLARVSVALLPAGEFALRLPAVLASLLCLVGTALAANRLLRSPMLALGAFAVLALHPLTLEYMNSARGYSLALGFWLLALALAAKCIRGMPSGFRQAAASGALLGLAFSANATYVVPGAAVLAALWVSRLASRRAGAGREIAGWTAGAFAAGLPAAVYIILMANRESFYAGEATLRGSLAGLVQKGLHFAPTPLSTPRADLGHWVWFFVQEYGWVVLSVLILAGLCRGVMALALSIRGARAADGGRMEAAPFAGTALVACIAIVAVLNVLFQLRYPQERTGLYLIPLAAICFFQGLEWLLEGGWLRRAAAAIPAAYIAMMAVHFFFCLPVTWHSHAKFDAGSRATMEFLARQPRGEGKATIGGAWLLCEGVNYYRSILGLEWLEPMQRTGPEGEYDFYVLLDEDLAVARRKGLRIIFHHQLAGSYLAVLQR